MNSFSRWYERLTDRGFFALGLVVGSLLTLLLFVSLWAISPLVDQAPDSARNISFWPKKLISLEDTITQWLMMLFSIAAFFVLLRTLQVTRKVGKAQVAAYLNLNVERVEKHQLNDGKIKISVTVTIENTGNSPAYNARIGYNILYVAPDEVTEVIYDIERIGHTGNPHPVVPSKSRHNGATLSRTIDENHDAKIRFMYMIQFEDVFGDTSYSPIFSGILIESPEGSGKFVFGVDNLTTDIPLG